MALILIIASVSLIITPVETRPADTTASRAILSKVTPKKLLVVSGALLAIFFVIYISGIGTSTYQRVQSQGIVPSPPHATHHHVHP
jgi:hypothetical protein